MNIQPITAGNITNKVNYIKNSNTKPVFKGNENKNIDEKRIMNAMKALALSSAIAFSPSLISSCSKIEIDDDCDHPNHIDPPFPNDSTDVDIDTVYTGKTYEVPEIKMQRYKVSGSDTTRIGSVTFSQGIIHVPYNANKSSELKTILKFIDVLGLKSQTLNKEYAATKAFDYNEIPAQLTWLNEKNGTVNQLKYNGYESKDKLVRMDLISIPENSAPVERRLDLILAGNDKLLVQFYDKDGKTKYTEKLFTLENNTISQFNINKNNNFEKVCEYTKGTNPSNIYAKDQAGNTYKLANFDVLTAIAEEK